MQFVAEDSCVAGAFVCLEDENLGVGACFQSNLREVARQGADACLDNRERILLLLSNY